MKVGTPPAPMKQEESLDCLAMISLDQILNLHCHLWGRPTESRAAGGIGPVSYKRTKAKAQRARSYCR